jgi:hypothetical protein
VAGLLAACGGFLLAVLWMDLLFDVQVLHMRPGAPAGHEQPIASIAAYYRRVTTEAFPLNRLIAAVMLLTLGGSAYRAVVGPPPRALAVLALLLATGGIGLALVRVVANAVRLGTRADTLPIQARLARTILRDHVCCFVLMLAFTAIQVWTSRR